MNLFRHFPPTSTALLVCALLLGGCSARQMVIGSLADELAAQGTGNDPDIELVRDASAFYLKLSESVLRQDPAHGRLAESVSSGFAQYAYAFVAFEADKIEEKNAKEAERLRFRAAGLYKRAHLHALNSLEAQTPGFKSALKSMDAKASMKLRPAQVPLAYWAAAAWGGWISLAKDDPDVVADLPLAIRLAELAWATDPNWGDGALTGLLGSFEAGRTGGNLARAQGYFDQSIQQSNGRLASPLVGKAEGYALPAGDRELFETLLAKAISIQDDAGSPLSLQNEIMRQRARWLLQKTNELF